MQMLIEKRLTVSYKHTAENEGLAKKKKQETLHNFRNEDIHLAFVDADQQLKQLAQRHLEGNISKTRHFITVQEIRDQLFQLCNLVLYGLNVRDFCSHEPGDKTPLNSRCC